MCQVIIKPLACNSERVQRTEGNFQFLSLPCISMTNTCYSLLVLLWPRVPGNKLTQKGNADSEVQFITLAGPRQSLLLAKDPEQFL